MTVRYWTADSDRDWEDSVGMFEEPPAAEEEPPEEAAISRQQAFEAFFAAVEEAIPETVEDWEQVRLRVREAGLRFAHAAVDESVARILRAIKCGIVIR